jgi:hypothetical protein
MRAKTRRQYEGIDLEQQNHALAELQRRFATRLDACLDGLGYPVLKAGRTRALATTLGVDISVATSLLSGVYLPDFGQLLAVCEVVRQQPGYFLDEHVLDVPPGTTVVKPMEHGEDVVLRLPSEVLSDADARRGLRYWRTTVAMGFGIGAGEYVIALGGEHDSAAEPGKLYLLSSKQGIDVVQCSEVYPDRAVFHRAGAKDVPIIVPTGKRGRRVGEVSKLVASIRAGSSLYLKA